MTDGTELRILTEKLVAYMEMAARTFQQTKKSGEKGDFYREVKPFADEVKETNDKWLKEATNWLEENQPKNMFIKQIHSTYDQIETLSIQAYFPETSQTRFNNYLQSVRFILKNILDRL